MRTTMLWLLTLALLGAPPVRADGGLAFLGRLQNNTAGVLGLKGALAVAVSPDGRSVYTASDTASSVSAFVRDPATGALRFIERELDNTNGVDGLDHVRALALSPDGANVYAAGDKDDAVAVFQRDPSTSALTFLEIQRNGVGSVNSLNGPSCVIVSPDGGHVYVGASGANALVLFTRDPASGALTFVRAYVDGVGGVSGLRGPQELVFSADARYLYVASLTDNSVSVFAVHGDGSLDYVDRYQHSATVFDGMDGVQSVVVTPDGESVYAAGNLDDSIAHFQRDPTTGKITWMDYLRDQVNGVDGLDAVERLVIDANGRYLYAVASKDNAVTTFLRDSATGALTFVATQKNGTGTLDAISGAKALALSPEGTSLYVAAASAGALNVFDTRCGDGVVGPGEQCDDGNGVSGDGCSAGCRIECATVLDCADNNACTTEVCRNGECAMPECGLHGTFCELGQAIPEMQAIAECLPLDKRLGRTIRAHLRQARQTVQLVRFPPPPPLKKNGQPKKAKKVSMRTLNKDVGKILTNAELKAGKLQQRGAISSDCLAMITAQTEELRAQVSDSLQLKGQCLP